MALGRPVHVINTAYHLPGGNSMQSIAERCVQHMIEEQPEGAFDLGGLCNGGLLAWEIANQLIAAGRTVNRVILVDTLSLNTRLPYRLAATLSRKLPRIVPLNSGRTTPIAALWLSVLDRWTPVAILRQAVRKTGDAAPTAAAPNVRNNLLQAMAGYVPPPLPVHLYCLIASESAHLPEFDPKRWRPLARDFSVSVVPGDHASCVSFHADYLAQTMRACLDGPPAQPVQAETPGTRVGRQRLFMRDGSLAGPHSDLVSPYPP